MNRRNDLRKRMETKLGEKARNPSNMSPEQVHELVHELQTHQIELEMQNEELRLAQEELAESHEKYADLFDFAPVGYATLNQRGLILKANLTLAEMLGVDRKSLVDQPLASFVVAEDQDAFHIWQRETGETQDRQNCELRMRRGTGLSVWTELHFVPSIDPTTAELQNCVSIIDISRRKQAEDSLQQEHATIDAAINSILDVFYIIDLNGKVLRWNKRVREVTKYSDAEIAVMDVLNFFCGEDQQRVADAVRKTVEHGTAKIEVELAAKDGTRIPFEFAGAVVKDSAGELIGICGCGRDVSERNRAAEVLHNSERDLARAQQIARLGSWRRNLSSGRVEWSDEIYRLLGLSVGEPKQPTFEAFLSRVHPEDRNRAAAVLEAAAQRKEAFDFEIRTVPIDGQEKIVSVSGKVERDADGTPTHIFGVDQDITEQRQAEEELRIAKLAADASNRAKSEFLANMSHEIRTPMTAIIGFTDLLLSQDSSPEEQRDYLTIIQRNAGNLLAIINDILDLAKIEAEMVQLDLMDCAPKQVVEDVKNLMREKAKEKQLSLEIEYVEPLPATIRTDPGKLRQILVNLVGNAVKFTHSGSVRITMQNPPGPCHDGSQLQFRVADTGVGIESQAVKDLFKPFTQSDMSSTREFGGTGLGLSISQRLAGMLGGRIEVESELGRGTTFTLTIDVGRSDKAATPEPPCDTGRP